MSSDKKVLRVCLEVPSFPVCYWKALHSSAKSQLAPNISQLTELCDIIVYPDAKSSLQYLHTNRQPYVAQASNRDVIGDAYDVAAYFGPYDNKECAKYHVTTADNLWMEEKSSNNVSSDHFITKKKGGRQYVGIQATMTNFIADDSKKTCLLKILIDECEKQRNNNSTIDGIGKPVDGTKYSDTVNGHRLVKEHRYAIHEALNHQNVQARNISRAYWGSDFSDIAVSVIHILGKVDSIIKKIKNFVNRTDVDVQLDMMLWTPSTTKPPSVAQLFESNPASMQGFLLGNRSMSQRVKGGPCSTASIPTLRSILASPDLEVQLENKMEDVTYIYSNPHMHYLMKKCNSKTAWTVCTRELEGETYWIIAPFNDSENDATYEIKYDIGEICVINITKNTYENERRQEIIDLIRNSDSVTMHKILPIHGQDKYVDDSTVTLSDLYSHVTKGNNLLASKKDEHIYEPPTEYTFRSNDILREKETPEESIEKPSYTFRATYRHSIGSYRFRGSDQVYQTGTGNEIALDMSGVKHLPEKKLRIKKLFFKKNKTEDVIDEEVSEDLSSSYTFRS